MQIKHQCILSIDEKRILIIPNGEELGIHSAHVADFIICNHDQFKKYKKLIEENMNDNCQIIFTD